MVVNVIRLRFNSTNSLGILQFAFTRYSRDLTLVPRFSSLTLDPYVFVIYI